MGQKPAMTAPIGRFPGYTVFILANVVGSVSMLAIWVFFFAGPFGLVELPGGGAAALAWDGGLSLAFFLQHSVMARKSFRGWLEKSVPSCYDGALYTIASGVILLAIVMLWQNSDQMLIAFQGAPRWILRGVLALASAWMAWGFLSLGVFDSFGLDPLRERLWGRPCLAKPFTVRGPYRWVRHPLYMGTLLFIWSCPDITLDRLFFNITWTAWMVIGMVFEERDLVASFGAAYREYKKEVPMVIPWRGPRHFPGES
jgi:protein-S-isoprenylcysteine O-methyltransferase Ste14